jgi:hypothetical protein
VFRVESGAFAGNDTAEIRSITNNWRVKKYWYNLRQGLCYACYTRMREAKHVTGSTVLKLQTGRL